MENKTAVLFGGETLLVGKADRTAEEVTVRIVPVKEFKRLLAALEDEAAMAEIYCDKPPGWAESLSMEGLDAVIERGEALNADFFRLAAKRLARQERLVPGITSKLVQVSPTGSRK